VRRREWMGGVAEKKAAVIGVEKKKE